MNKKEPKVRHANAYAAEVLAKIAAYQSYHVPLLDEMTAEDYTQFLAWLNQAKPRTIKYLTRRAHTQISNELDVEMAEDIRWFRFLEVNFAHLQNMLWQQQEKSQDLDVQE
ncbi:hypothetical protein KDA_76020 [Dictyobacter alpinus]|uniref:Uncharacterized protein n=1 Tax=Dictyobacter alpinus TaxID=2014873 RepID=A0A402BL76_9CHLR|nr:hypothetical protein [Dictyobacter alpinus]GCE32118.1 hypothetical protein KDA_76020 [Dictyobacter alpinus]